MKHPNGLPSGLFAALVLLVLMSSLPRVYALYTLPLNSFVTATNETLATLHISSGTLAQVQSQIDTARAANTNAVLVVNLTGSYLVNTTPLVLPSKTCLYLNGSIQAVSSNATAAALILVTNQSEVSIQSAGFGATLDGAHADLFGLQVLNSRHIVVDGLVITRTGREGAYLQGRGSAVMDSQLTIARCDISACWTGIYFADANQGVAVDNRCCSNSSAGITLQNVEHCSLLSNALRDNLSVGLTVTGTNNVVKGNSVSGNPTGVHLSAQSAFATLAANTLQNNTIGIQLGGSAHTLFDNAFSGNASAVGGAGSGINIIPTLAPLSVTGNYFYPVTARNLHTGTAIVNGRGRSDLSITNGTVASVQSQYNTAVLLNPTRVIVLHLYGTFTLGSNPLKLSSYTCLVLHSNAVIQSGADTTAIKTIAATNASYVSVSGGTLDGASRGVGGIAFHNTSRVLIDGVAINNMGVKAVAMGGTNEAIHLKSGGAAQIVRGCSINECGARGIWVQAATGPTIIADSIVRNCRYDGVDLDSFTRSALVYGNESRDNTRYGIFVEEGAQDNFVINNYCARNDRGISLFAFEASPTKHNSIICNVVEANNRGLHQHCNPGMETSFNFYFNNVSMNNTEFCVSSFGGSGRTIVSNYFSQNVPRGNLIHNIAADTAAFFNPKTAPLNLSARARINSGSAWERGCNSIRAARSA